MNPYSTAVIGSIFCTAAAKTIGVIPPLSDGSFFMVTSYPLTLQTIYILSSRINLFKIQRNFSDTENLDIDSRLQ